MPKWKAYWQLMRFDKPIGIILLFIPVVWALLLAYQSHPPFSIVLLFTTGVILTRAAGCVINDLCDRDIDRHVSRTQSRPLTTGELTVHEAMIALLLLCVCLFGLWWALNPLARLLGLIAASLTLFYPFTKRFFAYPQAVLGITFNMGVLMVFAQTGQITPQAWILYAASVVWTFTYDTIYAMADQQDDQRIGVHSSALSLGKYQHIAMCAGYACTFLLLAWACSWPLFETLTGVVIWTALYGLIFKRLITQAPLTFFKANAVLGGVILILIY